MLSNILNSIAIIILAIGMVINFRKRDERFEKCESELKIQADKIDILEIKTCDEQCRISYACFKAKIEWVYNDRKCEDEIFLTWNYKLRKNGDYIEALRLDAPLYAIKSEPTPYRETIRRVYKINRDRLVEVDLEMYKEKYYPTPKEEAKGE